MNRDQKNRQGDLLTRMSINGVLFLIFFALWFALTRHSVRELVLPRPESVWEAGRALQFKLLEYSMATLMRVVLGWCLGCFVGFCVGLLMTWSRFVYVVLNPIVEILRPLPPIALVPFFILWFGLGIGGQIGLIALGCGMVLTVSTIGAVHSLSPLLIKAAQTLGASKLRIYRTVIVPGILPRLTAGLRVAAALAFATAIAAEFMGAQSGLGFMIMLARRTLNTNTIVLGVIILSIESYAFDRLLRYVMEKLCQWEVTPQDVIYGVQLRGSNNSAPKGNVI